MARGTGIKHAAGSPPGTVGPARFLLVLAVRCLAVLGLAQELPAQIPVLDSLAAQALDANPSLSAGAWGLEEQAAEVEKAGSLFLPRVSVLSRVSVLRGNVMDFGDLLNPAYQTLNTLTGSNSFPTDVEGSIPSRHDSKLRVEQPVLQLDLLWNLSLQKRLLEVKRLEYHLVARQLRAETKTAFLSFAKAAQVVEAYDQALAQAEEGLRVAERLTATGQGTREQVAQARAQLHAYQQKRAQSALDSLLAARQVNVLLARPDDAPLPKLVLAGPPPPLPDMDSVRSRALSSREELRQLEEAGAIAGLRGRLASAHSLPSVGVAFDYGFQGDEVDFDEPHKYWMASAQLTWELFAGGLRSGEEKRAKAERHRTRNQADYARRRIALEVEKAHREADLQTLVVQAAGSALESRRSSLLTLERRQAAGEVAQVEVLGARAGLTSAEVEWIVARYDLLLKRVELEKAAALAGPSPVPKPRRLP